MGESWRKWTVRQALSGTIYCAALRATSLGCAPLRKTFGGTEFHRRWGLASASVTTTGTAHVAGPDPPVTLRLSITASSPAPNSEAMASDGANLVIGYWHIRGLAAPLRRALLQFPSHCALLPHLLPSNLTFVNLPKCISVRQFVATLSFM